jgi:hypothetical protein
MDRAQIDLQQEQNATSAVAVAKQAEKAFGELALTRMQIDLMISQTDDFNEQTRLENYGAAIDFIGNGLFAPATGFNPDTFGPSPGLDADGEPIQGERIAGTAKTGTDWMKTGLTILGGIAGFFL